ncbi:Bifunctional transcriptional activator/DNA repair enzyme Ada [Colletotrichum sp. SAR 10_99]|nr:Bifunctional transcriptional activator/DNA repair enzyme Ada [Colletotrichum sp. SAR 10_96]KAJ5020157.1 Bifunctional transcriptional activator/DNA repair enzyme Ada [Colletotrichum sp. SAR 10_99]
MASQANEISDSARWLLVSRRDLSANSSFFYGVKSTQIFCRPTCPGRVARRGNVIFFNDLQHASQSGYRPCKRCEPCNDSWSRENSGRRIAHRAHAMIVAAEADNVKWTVESMARKLETTTDLEDLYAVGNFADDFTSWFADDMDSLTSIDLATDPGS